jgi:hypothetical protein
MSRKTSSPAAPVDQPVRSAPEATGRGSGTVTVACKLESGIIIHAEREVERQYPVLGGGMRPVKEFERIAGSEITIFGCSAPTGGAGRTRIVAGYALTENVPADVWGRWLATHGDMPAVRNGLLFAYPTTQQAVDAAKDHKGVKSGLEPLNPVKDERNPRSPSRRITLEKYDEAGERAA